MESKIVCEWKNKYGITQGQSRKVTYYISHLIFIHGKTIFLVSKMLWRKKPNIFESHAMIFSLLLFHSFFLLTHGKFHNKWIPVYFKAIGATIFVEQLSFWKVHLVLPMRVVHTEYEGNKFSSSAAVEREKK